MVSCDWSSDVCSSDLANDQEANRPAPVSRFKARRDRTSYTLSTSPGMSIDRFDDTSQTSLAISAVESESEDSWQPETRNRKRHTVQSTRIDPNRRKRRKRDFTEPSRGMDCSVTASSLATPLLCSNCSALLTSTAYLDERPEGSSPGQRAFALHTPFSEVSSDIKGSAVPNDYLRKRTQHRRSESSVLEDLVHRVETRSTKGIPRIRKKQPTNKSLSAIDRFIAELNDEDQSPDSEAGAESSQHPMILLGKKAKVHLPMPIHRSSSIILPSTLGLEVQGGALRLRSGDRGMISFRHS